MGQKPQLRQYVHAPEDEDIGPLERFYRAREGEPEYNGREVLYLTVETTGITFCDGSYASRIETVNVMEYKTNERGGAVSEIEPIEDKEMQQEIREMLQRQHISKLNFGVKGGR